MSAAVGAGDVPPQLLEEALEEGFLKAGDMRQYEAILGLQLRGTEELEATSSQLFGFRRPEPQSKASSVCLGASLLEVSKILIRKLPGTTLDGVRRLQQQSLKSGTCQRLLTQSGGDCAGVRVGEVPRCLPTQPYRTLDGTCNNLRQPKWGAANTPFTRYLRPFYEDGLDEPRGSGRPPATALPSPRKVSVVMTEGTSFRPKPLLRITSLVAQFGQFLDHDLTHTPESAVRGDDNTLLPFGCCERGVPPSPIDQQRVPDCRPIDLSEDPLFKSLGRSCMRFVRSLVADNGCKLGPREQLNQVTSYLDGSVLYGTSQFLSNHLRDQRSRGQLKHTLPPGSSPQQGQSCPRAFCNAALLPEQRCHSQTTQSCFIAGDGRANEQPGLMSLHILFMRVHNSVAADLARININWSGETVFQETRRVVVALLQQVVYRELLPVVLGSGPMDHFSLWLERDGYFHGYNETIDPTTPNVFASAAFRFGHSLVEDVLMRGAFSNVTLLNSFFQTGVLKQSGTRPSQFLKSITEATSQEPDEYIVPTLTNSLFGSPSFPIGFDLYAINIMRGRDHGLAGYTEWRTACGLSRPRDFVELAAITNRQSATKLQSLYKTVEDIDLFPGALSEPPLGNGILGPTFACLIGQHFHDLKVGDRFWHENLHQPKPLTIEQLRELREIWFVSLLCHHTDIEVMQPSPFLASEPNRNPLRDCPSYKKLDLRAWKEGFGTVGDPVMIEGPAQPPVEFIPTRPPPKSPTERPHPVTRPPPSHPTQFSFQTPSVTQRPQPATPRPPPTGAWPPVTRPPPESKLPPTISQRPQGSQTFWPSVTRPPVTGSTFPFRPETADHVRPQVHPTEPSPISEQTPGYPPHPISQRPITFPTHDSGGRPTTQRPSIHLPPYYPPQILPPFGIRCQAVSVWRRLPGMDTWCTNNCYHQGSSYCPASHCKCS